MTGVLQHHLHLAREEWQRRVTSRRFGRERVGQGIHGRRRHAFEQAAVLGDVDKRSTGAQPETPNTAHRDVGEPTLDDVVGQRVDDAVRAEREAACRLAHVGTGAHGAFRDHAVLSRAASVQALQALGSIRIVCHRLCSSCTTEAGLSLPCTSPSITTTGATLQAPTQCAVRTEI